MVSPSVPYSRAWMKWRFKVLSVSDVNYLWFAWGGARIQNQRGVNKHSKIRKDSRFKGAGIRISVGVFAISTRGPPASASNNWTGRIVPFDFQISPIIMVKRQHREKCQINRNKWNELFKLIVKICSSFFLLIYI